MFRNEPTSAARHGRLGDNVLPSWTDLPATLRAVLEGGVLLWWTLGVVAAAVTFTLVTRRRHAIRERSPSDPT